MNDLIKQLEQLDTSGWKPGEVIALRDVITRLKRGQMVYDRLMAINDGSAPTVQVREYDSWHDQIFTSGIPGPIIPRKSENRPIKLEGMTHAAGTVYLQDEETRLIFEHDLEGYYQNAWCAVKRLRALPGAKKTGCAEIRDVRNHLIEHRSGLLENFRENYAFGSSGPIVCWTTPKSHPHRDQGLIHNHAAFAAAIQAWLDRQ